MHIGQLAIAVIRQAVADAQRPDGEQARWWLQQEALEWFDLMGIGVRPDAFRAWLKTVEIQRGGDERERG